MPTMEGALASLFGVIFRKRPPSHSVSSLIYLCILKLIGTNFALMFIRQNLLNGPVLKKMPRY